MIKLQKIKFTVRRNTKLLCFKCFPTKLAVSGFASWYLGLSHCFCSQASLEREVWASPSVWMIEQITKTTFEDSSIRVQRFFDWTKNLRTNLRSDEESSNAIFDRTKILRSTFLGSLMQTGAFSNTPPCREVYLIEWPLSLFIPLKYHKSLYNI